MSQYLRPESIPFIDIAAQRLRLGHSIDDAVALVLTHCQFINGPEVAALEAALAAFCGAKYAVTCASGTDALIMVLMAKGVGTGDAVFCPSFTFCATGEAVALTGATPIFVDVDEATFNIDVASLKRGIATAKRLGLKPRGIIPVDLFGQSADHDAIAAVADAEDLFVLDDAAQSFGASYKGRRLGGLGITTTTSFFPAKPLGCYGDGGAIFTDDAEFAELLRSIRVHGQGADKYDNIRTRPDRPARYCSGRSADRKAKDLRGGNSRAKQGCRAIRERPRQRCYRPARCEWQYIGVGAVHHPDARRLRP